MLRLQSHGGKVTGSVSGVTDYLLKGEMDHVTGKCKKAAEKGTAVMNGLDIYLQVVLLVSRYQLLDLKVKHHSPFLAYVCSSFYKLT